jgi:hypothetical protein
MLTIELRESIAVPRETLWRIIADVLRQREFVAYQITEARQSNAANPGPEFKWKEQGVLLGKRYECDCGIFAWEPPEWLCFGTKDLFHVSYELSDVPTGTYLAYRCELPQTPEHKRPAFNDLCRQSLVNLKMLTEGAYRVPADSALI